MLRNKDEFSMEFTTYIAVFRFFSKLTVSFRQQMEEDIVRLLLNRSLKKSILGGENRL